MKLNFDANVIKSSIIRTTKAVPYLLLDDANKMGEKVLSKVPFISNKTDSFTSSLSQKTRLPEINKNTLVGGAVLGACAILAVGCIKTIYNKIKQIKENR